MSFNIDNIINDVSNEIHHKKSLKILKSSIDDYGVNIKTLSEKVFLNPTKKSRKWLMSIFENENSIGWIHIVRLLCKSAKINQDIVFRYLNDIDLKKENHSDKLSLNLLQLLKKEYNENRVVKLILESDYSHNSDISYMLKELRTKVDINFLPNKPKNLDDIHSSCVDIFQKLKTDNYSLEQREDILALDNTVIKNDLTIRVPKSHYDLVFLGEELNFCIGNGYYSREVKEKRCSVVSIYKNNKPIYGVQFNRYSIKQAYGFDNQIIPSKILVDIQNALISAPEVPHDFIAISDSKWINGYKYNDKDLYLLLNGHIYIYYDVEQDIYEQLILSERKGAFVNRIIKGTYEYKKLS